jgi:hypothetical protein
MHIIRLIIIPPFFTVSVLLYLPYQEPLFIRGTSGAAYLPKRDRGAFIPTIPTIFVDIILPKSVLSRKII